MSGNPTWPSPAWMGILLVNHYLFLVRGEGEGFAMSQIGTWGTLRYPPRDMKRVLPLQLMDPKEPGLEGGGGGA